MHSIKPKQPIIVLIIRKLGVYDFLHWGCKNKVVFPIRVSPCNTYSACRRQIKNVSKTFRKICQYCCISLLFFFNHHVKCFKINTNKASIGLIICNIWVIIVDFFHRASVCKAYSSFSILVSHWNTHSKCLLKLSKMYVNIVWNHHEKCIQVSLILRCLVLV